MCMRSLATTGYEMKKTLADRKSDNNNKNNVGGHWGPVLGCKNHKSNTIYLLQICRYL